MEWINEIGASQVQISLDRYRRHKHSTVHKTTIKKSISLHKNQNAVTINCKAQESVP